MADVNLNKSNLLLGLGVKFTYTDNSVSLINAYVRGEDEVTIDSIAFVPAPTLEVKMQSIQGGLEAKPWTVIMDETFEPLLSMRFGTFQPVDCEIFDVDLENGDSTSLFKGTIHRTKAFLSGKTVAVSAEVMPRKGKLKDVPLGIIASDTCVWALGDPLTCGFVFNAGDKTQLPAIVSSVAGSKVTISGASAISQTTNFYAFGHLSLDGRLIQIIHHEGDVVTLAFPPPPSWETRTLTITAGCDKKAATCISKFDRAERFMGIGILIPDRNPLFETG